MSPVSQESRHRPPAQRLHKGRYKLKKARVQGGIKPPTYRSNGKLCGTRQRCCVYCLKACCRKKREKLSEAQALFLGGHPGDIALRDAPDECVEKTR